MNRLIIIGRESYIGTRYFQCYGYQKNIIYTSIKPLKNDMYLDINKKYNLDYIRQNDIIIFLVSISSPDICQQKYEFAYKINVDYTIQFMERVVEKKAKVLFFSSDTVYGNVTEVFDETKKPKPVGRYAEMKYEVEKYFMGCHSIKIFRLSYVFSKYDKFTSYLGNCVKSNIIADVYHPVLRTVVYIQDVISAIDIIYNRWTDYDNQIFNISGSDLLSRVDMAKMYRDNVNSKLLYKISTPDKEYYTARPKVINMNSIFFKHLLGRRPLSIENAIKTEFVENCSRK